MNWLDHIQWNEQGLIPVIAQEFKTGVVLMMAWMNREALALSIAQNRAVYWSRSRNKLWFKGEESGHIQHLKDIRLDCDNDVILLQVEQVGGVACHTGRHHCFYQQLQEKEWVIVNPILKDPATLYAKSK